MNALPYIQQKQTGLKIIYIYLSCKIPDENLYSNTNNCPNGSPVILHILNLYLHSIQDNICRYTPDIYRD